MADTPATDPFLLRLALALLAKAERVSSDSPVRLKLDRRTAPELYDQTDAEQVQRWVMRIEDLCATGWVGLKLKPDKAFAGFTDRDPQLELRDFEHLAEWVGYLPRHMQWQRRWLDHLAAYWSMNPECAPPQPSILLDYLARNPLVALRDMPLDLATISLEALSRLCASGREWSLREASARAFQGRSKVLDNREELLRQLGAAPGQFTEAPIQLLVDIPECFDEVLFVENLVTFESMADMRGPDWRSSLLVYAAGFRGSAQRLRSRKGCRLYTRATSISSQASIRSVENWLLGGEKWPVSFFGDLDYSGMQILDALRETFIDARAWRPGYALLADVIEQGGGHVPEQAAKELQSDPGNIGCAYADGDLLPLLRKSGRFVDQELFLPSDQEGSVEGMLRR